jgi:hypothetical protein
LRPRSSVSFSALEALQLITGVQHVRMAGSQYPRPVGQHLPDFGFGLGDLCPGGPGQAQSRAGWSACRGCGPVHDLQLVCQDLPVLDFGVRDPALAGQYDRDAVPGRQNAGVARFQDPHTLGHVPPGQPGINVALHLP